MSRCRCPACSPLPAPTYTRDWLLECDARDWRTRYRLTQARHGRVKAKAWWLGIRKGIEAARGKDAVTQLENLIRRLP